MRIAVAGADATPEEQSLNVEMLERVTAHARAKLEALEAACMQQPKPLKSQPDTSLLGSPLTLEDVQEIEE